MLNPDDVRLHDASCCNDFVTNYKGNRKAENAD